MSEAGPNRKLRFSVHTIGGEDLKITASSYKIDETENRVQFQNVDEENEGQWVFFLNAVAAIHEHPPRQPMEAAGGSYGYQEYI